jgi:hypothetical protein
MQFVAYARAGVNENREGFPGFATGRERMNLVRSIHSALSVNQPTARPGFQRLKHERWRLGKSAAGADKRF